MSKVKNKDNNQIDVNDVIVVSLLLTFDIFQIFLSISVVAFEHVNICWDNPWPIFY